MALKDKAMSIVVFAIFLNAVPNLMLAAGVADDMGIDPSISGDNRVESANQAANSIEPTGGFGDTLFTLYTSLGGTLQTIMEVLFGAELMFISLGIPDWIVGFLFAPKFIIFGGALIYVLAGRRL